MLTFIFPRLGMVIMGMLFESAKRYFPTIDFKFVFLNQGKKEIARISKRDVESWMFEGTKGLS